ncbi:uncharacterized protein BO66DRAFT_225105 [Aspergillus aculeatinus CBS 121060]|uniref:Uncharacterized protein n=1 Tax=Aspergillus aculeatinus CBS 121060 TaxID=1448322 RepID=A0ACD1HJI5_9EURO|nr:hypothetical protein BO66DRAFT_225105 [Aspergillus aculeatinus CBS 121060]RAH73528.1 hypothetical protein BO66DRAFT_225105 [Aspergillus aculeatinus CBS 121060]
MISSVSTFLIISLVTALADAFKTFDTNCTLPPPTIDELNYVSSPDTRGTLNILWSCLFTILACTWTVQHPDIPWQRKHFRSSENFKGQKVNEWNWKISKWKYSTAWFVTTILAPEIPLGKHLGDLWEAKRLRNQFEKEYKTNIKKGGKIEWTRKHWLFAIMGGFSMTTKASRDKIPQMVSSPTPEIENAVGAQSHSLSSSSQPEPSPDKGTDSGKPNKEDVEKGPVNQTTAEKKLATDSPEDDYPRILTPKEILQLVHDHKLHHLPDIDEEDIEDKSKSDKFIRVIAVFQILWLCIQVISRAVEHLAVSQLEIVTVAFALCAVIIYGLAWNKPQGVNIPISILQVSDQGADYGTSLEKETTPATASSGKGWVKHIITPEAIDKYFKVMEGEGYAASWFIPVVVLTGMLFSGVHLAAWRSHFPTHLEKLLWRIAAIYSTAFPLGDVLLLITIATTTEEHTPAGNVQPKHCIFKIIRRLSFGAWLLSFVVYFIARLYLLVEMFRTLAFQPTGAFVGTWAVNMPNIS